jgi:hypothetical protein
MTISAAAESATAQNFPPKVGANQKIICNERSLSLLSLVSSVSKADQLGCKFETRHIFIFPRPASRRGKHSRNTLAKNEALEWKTRSINKEGVRFVEEKVRAASFGSI